jgi:hypothetical protein
MSFGFGFALPAYPLRGGGGNNPFNQLGPTLDLSFAGVVTDQSDPNGYTLNTNFIIPQYQIAAQYVVWETGVGLVDKTFSQIITFTRASTATFFDSAGVLTSAATNAPRFDYNPVTLVAQGLLIEESRTNSIRNNTMVGAVAGTPGTLPTNWGVGTTFGLTREIVGTGTESGITYIDVRLSGTPSSAGTYLFVTETATGVAALNGQTWTNSGYFKLQAGTLTGVTSVRLYFQENNSGGTYLTEQNIAITNPTSAALSTQRASATRTLNQATTAFLQTGFNLLLTGAAIDITLRIGLPQLELGAFATSVIPTTTTALTRAADVASVNTLSPWYNASAGTLYAEFSIPSATASRSQATFGDGTANERMIISNNSSLTGTAWRIVDGGVDQADINNTGSFANNATVKVAGAYAVNDFATSQGGGTVGTDTSGTLPTVTTLYLGSNGAAQYASSYLRRITYYPRRLANAELQSITS